jgi:MFS transporter, PAT family, beta-lactamase induction signal transducer AmpG
MADAKLTSRNPWAWIPTLYFAEGLPYVVVMTLAVVMYKGLGLSNTDIALYTSLLYLPWVIKPFWSPLVDLLGTRRKWVWLMQLIIGAGLAGIALSVPMPDFFRWSLAFLWLLAFSSATHDIAADGYYLLATTEHEQAFFVGIRSTFYRIAMISGQGLLVIFAGFIQSHTGLPKVELSIEAKPGAAIVQSAGTNAWAPPSSSNLCVLASSSRIEISPSPREKAEVGRMVAELKARNIQHGFQPEDQGQVREKTEGWWTQSISQPLRKFIAGHFGAAKVKSSQAGNIGVAELQLSQRPDRETVLTLGLKSGDKSISLLEGSRLTFNQTNWNQPAAVVFQLDPKLRTAATAVYEIRSGNIVLSWSVTFLLLAGMFLAFGIYHKFVLPRPARDQPGAAGSSSRFVREFFLTFGSYFRKQKIILMLLFLLLYRFGEAQLMKMVVPFLLDGRELGGLGLTTGQVGFVYGTVGIIALTCGGLIGGIVASRYGLKAWLWPMLFIMHLPDLVFIYLANTQPDNLTLINVCVAIEQFGYGFGFTAYMLYMIYIARGKHPTAHYAICTGFMALGMMIPGMWSGWLQEIIGYPHFFVWVILATVPSFIVAALIPLEPEFGKRNRAN